MATLDSFVMGYILKQNRNAKSPVVGRWFASVDRLGNITTRGLAEYLVSLGVTLDRSDVDIVYNESNSCVIITVISLDRIVVPYFA